MSDYDWYNALDLCLEGQGWTDLARPYDRLPGRAKGVVREVVWDLSRQPTGLYVSFKTDASAIRARLTLDGPPQVFPRMASTAAAGLDLYCRAEGDHWRWAGASPDLSPEHPLLETIAPAERIRHYRLYLPLTTPVTSLEIGLPPGSRMEPGNRPKGRPIAVYGTSICHGYCASRPGMTHVAILGRWFNHPFINLGFAGNAQMEPEVGDLLAELDPLCYVIDPVPNMEARLVDERALPFLQTLMAARPNAHYLLVEARHYTNSWLRESGRIQDESRNQAWRRMLDELGKPAKWTHVPGELLFGGDAEASMDSSHPSDLGFRRMAEALEPYLREALRP